jgi:hypothetical protein
MRLAVLWVAGAAWLLSAAIGAEPAVVGTVDTPTVRVLSWHQGNERPTRPGPSVPRTATTQTLDECSPFDIALAAGGLHDAGRERGSAEETNDSTETTI